MWNLRIRAACIILILSSLCLCTMAQFLIRESHTVFFPLGVTLHSVHGRDNAYLMIAAFIIFILTVLCVAIGFIYCILIKACSDDKFFNFPWHFLWVLPLYIWVVPKYYYSSSLQSPVFIVRFRWETEVLKSKHKMHFLILGSMAVMHCAW